jgi:hypothetical protein
MQIFWVDEEGSFVPRKSILGGEKHVELTCSSHVWIVIVVANSAANKRTALLDLLDEEAIALKKVAKEQGVGSDAWLQLEERQNYGNLMLAVRPCDTSLIQDRCTNLVWIPWRSMSLSQRQHPVKMPDYKLPADRRAFDLQNGPNLHPNMHVQVLDIAAVKRRKQPPSSAGAVAAATAAEAVVVPKGVESPDLQDSAQDGMDYQEYG